MRRTLDKKYLDVSKLIRIKLKALLSLLKKGISCKHLTPETNNNI